MAHASGAGRPRAATGRLQAAIARQVASNESGRGHERSFAGHRARLTQEILRRAPAHGRGRLCLLGAGNAADVDLDALAARFHEIHLVDIDAKAVRGAVGRTTGRRWDQMRVHAPVDASGIFDRLEGWSDAPPPAHALAAGVEAATSRVVGALPGPFDVVVSCCLLTQLQLVLLEIVGDRNPAFDDLRAALSRIHVRTLTRLLAPDGVALLATDLTGSDTYPLDDLPFDADLGALMTQLLAAGNVIHAAHPGRLSAEIRRDPTLAARYAVRFPIGPWLWHNGPERTYLVYAVEIMARAADSAGRRD
jgi:hypothetical protein